MRHGFVSGANPPAAGRARRARSGVAAAPVARRRRPGEGASVVVGLGAVARQRRLCDIRSGDRGPAKRDHSHAQCILCRICPRDEAPAQLVSERPRSRAAPRGGALRLVARRRPPPASAGPAFFSPRAAAVDRLIDFITLISFLSVSSVASRAAPRPPGRRRMSAKKSHLIRALFERNRRVLTAYLTRRVGAEAAPDLLQETFVRALRHERLDDVADPPAFLQQFAANLTGASPGGGAQTRDLSSTRFSASGRAATRHRTRSSIMIAARIASPRRSRHAAALPGGFELCAFEDCPFARSRRASAFPSAWSAGTEHRHAALLGGARVENFPRRPSFFRFPASYSAGARDRPRAERRCDDDG